MMTKTFKITVTEKPAETTETVNTAVAKNTANVNLSGFSIATTQRTENVNGTPITLTTFGTGSNALTVASWSTGGQSYASSVPSTK